MNELSLLEKAHYAAKILSEMKYKGIEIWIVQETIVKSTRYGEKDDSNESNLINTFPSPYPKEKQTIRIHGGFLKHQLDPEDAYIIAKSITVNL